MKTIVYCEKGRLHALELIPKASSFSETIIALCEDADASAAAMQAGRSVCCDHRLRGR